jgi:DNA-binding response OmpR family regulator
MGMKPIWMHVVRAPKEAHAMKQQLIEQHSAVSAMGPSDLPEIRNFEVTDDTIVQFRRFRAVLRTRQLLVDGKPVEIGSRAFDLLVVLIGACGALVSKEEIMNRVWPTTVVEEANLRVQVSELRKILGEDRDIIKTIPGRGYVFAAKVAVEPVPVGAELGPRSHGPISPGDFSASNGVSGQLAIGSRSTVSQPTVVVVVDDEDTREALEGLFRSVGLHVETFASAQEFLKSPREIHPQCLVLDVRLPGRSGLDLFDDLTKRSLNPPVIFISGYADVPMSVRAMKAGALEFLTKPVRHQDLLDAVQLAIGSHPSLRSTRT